MREYKDRQNAQARAYYSDRFYKSPQLPKGDVATDEVFNSDFAKLKEKHEIKESYIQRGQMVLVINPRDIRSVMTQLKDELDYTFLSELSAVDFLQESNQFEIFYQMLSMKKRKRLRVKYRIEKGEAVDSIVDVFHSADWAEREMFDMFGIVANNHPYLKRLIMPDDWVGHPLLKTYPLVGDEAASWYEIDTIFGKEHREVVGPENRDTKRVDPKDTKNFARIGHEVPYGADPKEKDESYKDFQEEGGVLFITRFRKDKQKILKNRK